MLTIKCSKVETWTGDVIHLFDVLPGLVMKRKTLQREMKEMKKGQLRVAVGMHISGHYNEELIKSRILAGSG